MRYLVSQLHRVEANPPRIAEDMMAAIADVLKDEDANALVSEYRDTASYEDLDQEESEDVEVEDSEPPSESSDENQADTKKIDAATARQRRTAMVRSFIATVEKKMPNR